MSIKISGLDKLQRTLTEAQRALSSLDGTITTLQFDPADPASVQNAIRQMEQAVDRKASPYASNPIVAPLIKATKEQFRAHILKKAKESS